MILLKYPEPPYLKQSKHHGIERDLINRGNSIRSLINRGNSDISQLNTGNLKSCNPRKDPTGSESFPVSAVSSPSFPQTGDSESSAMCLAHSTTRNFVHTLDPLGEALLQVSYQAAHRAAGGGTYEEHRKMFTTTRSRKEPKSNFFPLSFFPGRKCSFI